MIVILIIKIIYNKYKFCTDYYKEITGNMNCIEYIDNYYLEEGTNIWYNINYINKGFYLNDNNKFFLLVIIIVKHIMEKE